MHVSQAVAILAFTTSLGKAAPAMVNEPKSLDARAEPSSEGVYVDVPNYGGTYFDPDTVEEGKAKKRDLVKKGDMHTDVPNYGGTYFDPDTVDQGKANKRDLVKKGNAHVDVPNYGGTYFDVDGVKNKKREMHVDVVSYPDAIRDKSPDTSQPNYGGTYLDPDTVDEKSA